MSRPVGFKNLILLFSFCLAICYLRIKHGLALSKENTWFSDFQVLAYRTEDGGYIRHTFHLHFGKI